MIYLSGHYSAGIARAHPRLGFMVTPETGYRIPSGVTWAADNGCFATPELFDIGRYVTWLGTRADVRDACLFAVAPDRMANAAATLELYPATGRAIRAAGYRAALVAQDGLERLPVPWDDLDCLFVGGTTAWKLSEPAYQLGTEAKRRGKWVHVGRVNGYRRLQNAASAGFDSADGTKLAFGPTANLPMVLTWLDRVNRQRRLFA